MQRRALRDTGDPRVCDVAPVHTDSHNAPQPQPPTRAMPASQTDRDCPCDLGKRYADCCGRYHAGALRLGAPTADALMRSRYSAYVLQLDDYLLDTWHPDTRPTTPFVHEPGLRWLGLDVKRHTRSTTIRAIVEFVARSKLGGRAQPPARDQPLRAQRRPLVVRRRSG